MLLFDVKAIIFTTEMETKVFKYSEQIESIEQSKNKSCSSGYAEIDAISFRWTFKDIEDDRNFKPRAMFGDIPNIENIKENCGGWSLSLFNSLSNAKKALRYQIKKRKNIYKKLGTHIAAGKIDENHGVAGELNEKSGHFEFMEYQDANFYDKFEIVHTVVEVDKE